MSKDHYAKMTCLFLVEGLRTRKLPLPRVVEISEKFLAHVNLLESERDFLMLVKELAKDFEELLILETKVLQSKDVLTRRQMEQMAKEFAIKNMPNNPQLALASLKDACGEQVNIEALKSKFPEFKTFAEEYERAK